MDSKSNKSDKKNLTSKLQTFIPILALILLGLVYFLPEFQGERIMGSDRGQSISNNQARRVYAETQDIDKFVIWNPGIFAGTSSLYSGVSKLNIYHTIASTLQSILKSKGAMIFMISLLLSYFLARGMGFSWLLSFLMAVSITFSLTNIILYKEGHESKIYTLVFIPLILWGFYALFEEKSLLKGALLLILGIGFSVYTRHPQMSYYLFLMMTPFFLIQLIYLIKGKEYQYLGKLIIVGLISVVIGLGSNADRLWNMNSHLEISMRGDKILSSPATETNTEKKSSGLDWEYAMQWSNSFPDMMTAIIPGFTGGSYAEKISKDSPLYKKYKIEAAPLYWKDFFSVAPTYLGVISIFFLVMTLIFYRTKWTIGLSFAILLSVLLSFGSNLEWFQRLFFDFVPMYNKFRAPQSILSVTVFVIPVVSMAFLYKLDDKEFKNELGKKLFYAMGGFLVFLLFATFIMPYFYDFSSKIDQNLAAQGADVSDFVQARKDFLRSDGKRAIALIAMVITLIVLYVNGKIKYSALVIGIIVLTLFDLLTVNKRYYSWDLYKNSGQISALYNSRNIDKEILALEKNREDYRVLDLSINTFNSGKTSYYHNTIGGYSPLKQRRYQDVIEKHIARFDMGVLNMLNTKYIIQKDGKLAVNNQANGIGWFVNELKYVQNPDEEIEAMSDLNLKNTAVIHEGEFKEILADLDFNTSSSDYIKYTSYHPDRIEYEVFSSGNNLAVFSEMFTDNEMWKAYIDGNEVDIIRSNYLLRSLKVPSGLHKVVFECKPESFFKGRWIALGFGLFTILILFANIYHLFKKDDVLQA
tara:strand:- start:12621 stop:15053 length:2433 start_codon:yes stop_codon:yes gene_type:complete